MNELMDGDEGKKGRREKRKEGTHRKAGRYLPREGQERD